MRAETWWRGARLVRVIGVLALSVGALAAACGESSGDGNDNPGSATGGGTSAGGAGTGGTGQGGTSAGGTGQGGAAAGGTPGSGGATSEDLLPPSLAPETSYCPFDDATDLTTFEGRSVVRVCPEGDTRQGCDVSSLQAAIDQAASGTRIEVVGDGAVYAQCGVISAEKDGLEIAGVCGRPRFVDTVCQSKGTFVHAGSNLTLTHIEVSGAWIGAADGGNGAAVRDESLGGLAMRYVYFHDNQNGILGGKGKIRIDWSRFEANGSAEDPGYTHNTYFSADVSEVVIQNSLFLRARHEGNNFKSRAQALVFRCSVSASLDGADSREMDLSEGGDALIENSLIQQGPESVNSGLLGFATESEDLQKRHAVQHLAIAETDFINDKGAGNFIAYNAYDTTVQLRDLRFIGSGTQLVNTNAGPAAVDEAGTESFPSRADAGLPAVSNDPIELPSPRGCPTFEYF